MDRQANKVWKGWALAAWLAVLLAACHGPATGPLPADAEVAQAAPPAATDSTFARLIERLSEPGGYFDTDNLISNEASYLHVLGKLRAMELSGGAYLGVGPDQNFAYIAQVRPSIAFIVDIRRDNLLQHVFFKALFHSAQTRIEYLCLLFGKGIPTDVGLWWDRDVEELVAYIDSAATLPDAIDWARLMVDMQVRGVGLPLSDADKATIEAIHSNFIREGLDLQFTSHGRAPRFYYPTYRDLLLEKDLTGQYGTFLAREEDYQFIRRMQKENRLVPVVGDLSGPHALAAIGAYLAERGEHVSAFYTSNVEFYLMRRGRFDRFAENVKKLPRTGQSVIIRSYFNRFSSSHPQSVSGYASTQLLQTIESLVEEHDGGGYQSYWDLINKHSLELR